MKRKSDNRYYVSGGGQGEYDFGRGGQGENDLGRGGQGENDPGRNRPGFGSFDVCGAHGEDSMCRSGYILGFNLLSGAEYESWTPETIASYVVELCRMLAAYKSGTKGREYPYLNPYTIAVCSGRIYLLAPDGKTFPEMIRWIQEEKVSETYFKPVARQRLTGFCAQKYRLGALLMDMCACLGEDCDSVKRRRLEKLSLELMNPDMKECSDYTDIEEKIVRASAGGRVGSRLKKTVKKPGVIALAVIAVLLCGYIGVGAVFKKIRMENSGQTGVGSVSQPDTDSSLSAETAGAAQKTDKENSESTVKNDRERAETNAEKRVATNRSETAGSDWKKVVQKQYGELTDMISELMQSEKTGSPEVTEWTRGAAVDLLEMAALRYEAEGEAVRAAYVYESIAQLSVNGQKKQSALLYSLKILEESEKWQEADQAVRKYLIADPDNEILQYHLHAIGEKLKEAAKAVPDQAEKETSETASDQAEKETSEAMPDQAEKETAETASDQSEKETAEG